MTSPARRPEPDPLPDQSADGDGYTYVGPMSYAEYRRFDEKTELRLEYVDGVVYAMSCGTRAHSRISSNVSARLYALCAGTGCTSHSQSFKVRTPRGHEYVPDVFVECGAPDDNAARYADAPCVIVEVLSPSTARVDRGEKRPAYQEIPTLGTYLIVEALWRGVHHHWRDAAGTWQQETLVGDGAMPLACPAGAVLTLADVYAGLDLPAAPPQPVLPRLRRVKEVPAEEGSATPVPASV